MNLSSINLPQLMKLNHYSSVMIGGQILEKELNLPDLKKKPSSDCLVPLDNNTAQDCCSF